MGTKKQNYKQTTALANVERKEIALKDMLLAPVVAAGNIQIGDVPDMMEGYGKDFVDEVQEIDSQFPPSVKWLQHGNFIVGIYEGVEQVSIGQRKANLYNFTYKDKRFGVWGTTNIDKVFEKQDIEEGDLVQIVYVDDVDTEMQPCKIFQYKVRKPKVKVV